MHPEAIGRSLDHELFKLSNTSVTPLTLLLLGLTVVASLCIGRLSGRAVSSAIARRGPHSAGLAYAMGRITQYAVVTLCVLIGLSNAGINLAALAAVGAVLTVAVGFGLQSIAQNFVSGMILLIERPVQKGDFIAVGGVAGTVQEIAMRATRITSREGMTVIVPNAEIIAAAVVNQSACDEGFSARVKVGVSYESDVDRVRELLLRAASEHASVLKRPRPQVLFRDFGDGSLDFELRAWIARPEAEPKVTSELRFAIVKAFHDAGVELSYPQRDLREHGGSEGSFRAARASA